VAVAGLLTEPRWLGQETGHSERFPEELRRYFLNYHPQAPARLHAVWPAPDSRLSFLYQNCLLWGGLSTS